MGRKLCWTSAHIFSSPIEQKTLGWTVIMQAALRQQETMDNPKASEAEQSEWRGSLNTPGPVGWVSLGP